MGKAKQIKTDVVRDDAQKAWDAGRRVFTARFSTGLMDRNNFSGTVKDWAEYIEAIEGVGWRLEHWSVIQATRGNNRVMAYPLFRRPSGD